MGDKSPKSVHARVAAVRSGSAATCGVARVETRAFSPLCLQQAGIVINAPTGRDEIEALRQKIQRGWLDLQQNNQALQHDAIRNFATLQELRDTETLAVRIPLRAAQTIAQQFDRELPRGGRE